MGGPRSQDGSTTQGTHLVSVTLLPYQVPAADALVAALNKHSVALDLSDAGVGKTFHTCEVLRRLAPSKAVVVCPKVVVPTWRRWAAEFGIEVEALTYEKLRLGKTGLGHWRHKTFEWTVPKDTIIVFDEAHRVGGQNTQNARMARDAKPFRKILLSATLAESPLQMRAVGHLTGMTTWGDWYAWCLRNGCGRQHWGGLIFPAWPKGRGMTADEKEAIQSQERARVLKQFHEYLLPEYGCRVRISDLGDAFPSGIVTADAYDMGSVEEITAAYDQMQAEIESATTELERERAATNALQIIERVKVPALAEMARDLVEQGQSVVIITNFRASLDALREELQCGGVYGGQADAERDAAVEAFQANTSHCIIVNIQAGGVGLSLHDLHGQRQRVMLISPTFSSKLLRQVLFRTRRQGSQSPAIAHIVYADGTPENDVCKRAALKLQNIDLLNDGDLSLNGLSVPLSNNEEFTEQESIQHPMSTNSCDQSSQPTPSTPVESSPNDTTKSGATSTKKASSTKKRSPKAASVTTSGQPTESAVSAMEARTHAKHSPSSLKYKWACPGWRGEESDGPNKWADRGTRGHAAVEVMNSAEISDDPNLKTAVDMCIAYVKHLRTTLTGSYEEHREVKLRVLDQYGHADLVITTAGGEAHLLDWKFASNLYEVNSPQFWAYTLGVFDRFFVHSVHVHVLHPWLNVISTHTFTRNDDYLRLMAAVRQTIAQAVAEDPASFSVNSGCVYCARAATCPALASLAATVAARYDNLPELPDGSLHGSEIKDPAVLAQLLSLAPVVEKAAAGWRQAALRTWQEDGVPIPGYNLNERAGARKVTSALTAYELFLEKGGKPEDFARITDVPLGDLEDLFASLAPKGKKGAAKQELNDLLLDRDAISFGNSSFYLQKQKTTNV